MPAHLRDAHYPGAGKLGHGKGYVYAHDEPHGVAEQQYLPDSLAGREYYRPTDRGEEREIGSRLGAAATHPARSLTPSRRRRTRPRRSGRSGWDGPHRLG